MRSATQTSVCFCTRHRIAGLRVATAQKRPLSPCPSLYIDRGLTQNFPHIRAML